MKLLTTNAELADPQSDSMMLVAALRADGCEVEVALDTVDGRADDAEAVFILYPGFDINPALLGNDDAYAEHFLKVSARYKPQQIVLFKTPRGPESLSLAQRLGVAATIEYQDLFIGLRPERIRDHPLYRSGISGRKVVLSTIGAEPDDELGEYQKVPVQPFPSLVALLLAYLRSCGLSK